nr:hypothetical protein [Tanacetum cinerariifolium]
MAQNIDFFGSDQIQTPQYPEVHHPSQETSEEVCQAREDLIKSIQTFLDKFDCIPFEKRPKIYLQTWDRPIFLNNNEEHSVQNKESLENPSNEIATSNSNEEKEEPPQDSDMHQLIREECCVEVSEEQKQKMEDTILELVKICQEKEFLCIHDNVDDLIESALNSKLLLINSNSQLAPILSTKEPEHSLSMGYEHVSITTETESDEVTESNAKNLLPIQSECKVTSEDKRDCDVPDSTINVCDNHYEILSDFDNDDDISRYDDDFEDIEYVEASLLDPEIVSEEENVVHQEEENDVEEEKVDLEDISQIQDVILREKLLSITRLIYNIKFLNDNSTPDRVLNSFEFANFLLDNFSPEFETFCDHKETRSDLLLEEADLFLAFDNSIPPGIENVANDSEGDIYFLEELLIDDSIVSHESSDSNFEDNPSVPRSPSEPPDVEFDAGKEISVVMNYKDKFDDDYSYFMSAKVLDICLGFQDLHIL